MDAELELRWKAGEAPFDGLVISLEALLPLPVVREALLAVADILQIHWPDAELRQLHDWHEHDGEVLPSRKTSWSEMEKVLSSDESLYAARAGDTYVRIGVYPEDFGFYLRFYPEDDEEEWDPPRAEHIGDFDLTCDVRLAPTVMERLTPLHLKGLRCDPAKEFFDARWNGD